MLALLCDCYTNKLTQLKLGTPEVTPLFSFVDLHLPL